jgi:hypothetical protein
LRLVHWQYNYQDLHTTGNWESSYASMYVKIFSKGMAKSLCQMKMSIWGKRQCMMRKEGHKHVLVSMNSRHKRTKITIGETMKD